MEDNGRVRSSSAILLAVLLFALDATLCTEARTAGAVPAKGAAAVEFIKTSCGKTAYPRLCYNSLASYASTVQTSPTQLADAALTVSLTGARSTSTTVTKLCKGRRMRPREAAAMKDCVENMSDSIRELSRAIKQMDGMGGGGDLNLKVSNVQTWVSAALTEEQTCLDGFAGRAMDGKLKREVRGQILKVAQLTSNALALVNGLAAISP